ncbi:MAG: hypothetical protein HC933_00870 [Pleurocapsa sp. SU_196_0]|nr:hypothetical protein [Pleurocapsa sp. SU_196_0]
MQHEISTHHPPPDPDALERNALETRLLLEGQRRLLERRAVDAMHKARLEHDQSPQLAVAPKLFHVPVYDPPAPRLEVPTVTQKRQEAAAAPVVLDEFTRAFQTALTTARGQYEGYANQLGSLFELATTIRATCLMFTPKAQARATLCAMVPMRFLVAAFDGRSREYVYRLLRSSAEGAFFKRLISFAGFVSDYWIGSSEDKAVRAMGGTLFTSSATMLPEGQSPKARYWDWKRDWRDLRADVRDNRVVDTLLAQLEVARIAEVDNGSQTTAVDSKVFAFKLLQNYFLRSSSALFTKPLKSVENVCEPEAFEAVRSALEAPIPSTNAARADWTERVASAIFRAVHDQSPREKAGWLKAAWTALKLRETVIGNPTQILLESVYSTLVRQFEGGQIQSLGAYTWALMRQAGWSALEATASRFSSARA